MIVFIKKSIGLLFLISIISTCQLEDGATNKIKSSVFFDLKDFFKQEAKRLAEVKQIQKKVIINGQVEEQTIDSPDWEKAFRIFTQSDINKTSWFDKYQVDTSYHSDQSIASIAYRALDKSLKTRELDVQFSKQQAQKIYILNEVNNPILRTQQQLTYEREKGYHVRSWQKQALAEERNLEIEVRFNQ